ncbi:amidohydrolase family protein [Gordonia terrae]|uniref:Cytosine deaminase n=2 Tax=Gordonia terrae TaxID=2055 RepID=A0AAD0KCG2_9ACTN|nr:amidohydrolase family protein [Gordonia terrae]VTR07882.1 cytosine deaminase [Clostridioides difficile]ANY25037.1 cytosine deaminase [Gordonia terrae]AWO85785.1 cytosine deaminase [Gordonia terrae]VTS61407.1 Cytosine deaminase [Gordonia terrae]GAB42428.1 cytosine deaminase [Gordonia terrae NBRC 100016]
MQAPQTTPAPGITGSLADGSVVDVELSTDVDGIRRVRAVTPFAPDASRPADWLDLRGHLLLPPAAEPHAHLDKALSWPELSPPSGDLADAIASWRAGSIFLDEQSFRTRALQATSSMLANGITAVRTHADVLAHEDPLRAVRVLTEVRDSVSGLMDIQIAVLVSPSTPTAHIEAALDAGVDLIGGAPHIADDPLYELTRLLDLAEEHGIGADLHVDEFLDGDHLTIEVYADRVADWPEDRIRTAGHCCRLDTLPTDALQRVARALARARVSVVALPVTNLYLQGRSGPSAGRRGITPIDVLRDHGVRVAGGADNIRDPFNPVGRADPLETAALLITAAHQSPDTATDLVTGQARAVLGLEPAGPVVGARADFVAIRGADLTEVIATAPADRVVIVNGITVARTETTTWSAFPSLPDLSPAGVTRPQVIQPAMSPVGMER